MLIIAILLLIIVIITMLAVLLFCYLFLKYIWERRATIISDMMNDDKWKL